MNAALLVGSTGTFSGKTTHTLGLDVGSGGSSTGVSFDANGALTSSSGANFAIGGTLSVGSTTASTFSGKTIHALGIDVGTNGFQTTQGGISMTSAGALSM